MSGLPPPASFSCVISDLFQNEKYTFNDVKYEIFFSKCKLTPTQVSQLTYTDGFTPCNFYIFYQTNGGSTPNLQLVSFLHKGKYIYGAYFDINNQDAFDRYDLVCSNKPIVLSNNAQFVSGNYLEVYHDVNGTTTILGIGPNISSLQYSRKCKYYYALLSNSGLEEDISTTYLTGLSHNLYQQVCEDCSERHY